MILVPDLEERPSLPPVWRGGMLVWGLLVSLAGLLVQGIWWGAASHQLGWLTVATGSAGLGLGTVLTCLAPVLVTRVYQEVSAGFDEPPTDDVDGRWEGLGDLLARQNRMRDPAQIAVVRLDMRRLDINRRFPWIRELGPVEVPCTVSSDALVFRRSTWPAWEGMRLTPDRFEIDGVSVSLEDLDDVGLDVRPIPGTCAVRARLLVLIGSQLQSLDVGSSPSMAELKWLCNRLRVAAGARRRRVAEHGTSQDVPEALLGIRAMGAG